jgi:hypothetical protein
VKPDKLESREIGKEYWRDMEEMIVLVDYQNECPNAMGRINN